MSLPVVSVIHATRGRPAKALSTRLDWLAKVVDPDQVEHLLVVDGDDRESLATFDPSVRIVVRPAGGAAAYNAGARHARGSVLVVAADDVVAPLGWDMRILERIAAGDSPGGPQRPIVLAVSDGNRRDRLLTHPILTRAYFEQLGRRIFDEEIGVAADADFTERAYADGVVLEARDLTFEHQHPAFGKGEWDDTYRRGNAGIAESQRRFRERWPASEIR